MRRKVAVGSCGGPRRRWRRSVRLLASREPSRLSACCFILTRWGTATGIQRRGRTNKVSLCAFMRKGKRNVDFTCLTANEIYTTLSTLSKDTKNWEAELEHVATLLAYPSNKIKAKALWLIGEMGLLYPQKSQPYIERRAP